MILAFLLGVLALFLALATPEEARTWDLIIVLVLLSVGGSLQARIDRLDEERRTKNEEPPS